MQIKLEHLDAESAWQRIIRAHERYRTNLKNYKYSYEMFIPNDGRMRETLRGLWGGIKWTWNYDRDTLPIILQKIPKRTKIKKVKA